MERSRTQPAELAGLDLFAVWTGAAELGDRFDPFRFEQRIAAYRLLIERLNRDGAFGADNRHNPLWGLVFQHQWQCRTGRLGPTTHRDGRIDPDAAWGYGNYALAVVPWLGAVAAGLVPDLPLAAPPGPSRFRYPGRDGGPFAEGVEDWRHFFLLAAGSTPGADQEPVRLALWKAHKTCLDVVAARLARIDPAPYPPLELTFLRGWCRMVDYLWAAAWPTDFDFMTEHGMDVLPERLLRRREDLSALPARVRGNVRNVLALASTSGWRHRVNLALWRRVMRTRAARDQVVPLLDALFNPRPDNTACRRQLVRYLLRP